MKEYYIEYFNIYAGKRFTTIKADRQTLTDFIKSLVSTLENNIIKVMEIKQNEH